jgi:hypothetical protein
VATRGIRLDRCTIARVLELRRRREPLKAIARAPAPSRHAARRYGPGPGPAVPQGRARRRFPRRAGA